MAFFRSQKEKKQKTLLKSTILKAPRFRLQAAVELFPGLICAYMECIILSMCEMNSGSPTPHLFLLKVPAFEGSDGTLLTESNAIAYYVANDELRGGSDAATRAQVYNVWSQASYSVRRYWP